MKNQFFSKQLAQYQAVAHKKGAVIDRDFFRELEPIEALLPEIKIATTVATGGADPYCTPAFLEYLRSLCKGNGMVRIKDPVANAPHEVTDGSGAEVIGGYEEALFT